MAAIPSSAFMAAFLPIARDALLLQPVKRITLLQRLQSIAIPAAVIPIPGVIGSIWEGILKAVPKKKTSHRKKRQRFLAGKALKDVTFLVKCSSCGRPKRAHILCPYCVMSIKRWFTSKLGIGEQMKEEADAVIGKVKPELRLVSKKKREVYEQNTALQTLPEMGTATRTQPTATKSVER